MRFRHVCAALLSALLMAVALCGCGRAGDVSKVEMDYGTSNVFLRQEIDDAAQLILEEFKGWKGCKLHNIRYVGDACNNEMNVRKVNSLWHGPGFDQHIEFTSSFSTSNSPRKSLGLKANHEYTDWHWHLARGRDEVWHMVYWGEK